MDKWTRTVWMGTIKDIATIMAPREGKAIITAIMNRQNTVVHIVIQNSQEEESLIISHGNEVVESSVVMAEQEEDVVLSIAMSEIFSTW